MSSEQNLETAIFLVTFPDLLVSVSAHNENELAFYVGFDSR
jgi:hypothetical protein